MNALYYADEKVQDIIMNRNEEQPAAPMEPRVGGVENLDDLVQPEIMNNLEQVGIEDNSLDLWNDFELEDNTGVIAQE